MPGGAPFIPYEICNLPTVIQKELDRRKVNRSFNYIEADKGEWGKDSGDWTKYKGPMVPWIRFCSNGEGPVNLPGGMKKGFVFFGGKDFYKGYGFGGATNNQVIGYALEPNNSQHIIENDLNTSNYPIHVPPPEIERISVVIQKELVRKATIEWVCFSKKQLEYMTPYFLVPGITCILEWGWNHFNPTSLIDLTNTTLLKQYNNNPYSLYTDHILKSSGNYDVLMGMVINFEWSIDGNKIRCKTEIMSQDRIYAGLVIDSAAYNVKDNGDKLPIDNLTAFVSQISTKFKEVATKPPDTIKGLEKFMGYLAKHHPKNWEEYAYGVFWGRDNETIRPPSKSNAGAGVGYGGGGNTGSRGKNENDFDKDSNKDVWISVGLLIEIINFHASELKGLKEDEMFRVDVDNVVIGAHPNMISSDGTILLIPNTGAPHYFWGLYGYSSPSVDVDEYNRVLQPSEESIKPENVNIQDKQIVNLAVPQTRESKRDNLDVIINWVRKSKSIGGISEFPFATEVTPVGTKDTPVPGKYPAKFSGYLKNIYFNAGRFNQLVNKDGGIKTYPKLIERVMEDISKATGNFWDLRLVSGTGQDNLDFKKPAPMKIVDYRFAATANSGTTMYTFDYMDADSLLLGLNFKPMLSMAKAIETMYSGATNPNKKIIVTNTSDELLEYKYRDRLFKDQELKVTPVSGSVNSHKSVGEAWKEVMRGHQAIKPKPEAYQFTTSTGQIRRLVFPCEEGVKMLLNDGDTINNPKYIGVMPNIQVSITIQGIGGLRTFMAFLIRGLPDPYSEKNILFRITNLQESIENGKWTTTIEAGVMPLRGDIKQRLGIST